MPNEVSFFAVTESLRAKCSRDTSGLPKQGRGLWGRRASAFPSFPPSAAQALALCVAQGELGQWRWSGAVTSEAMEAGEHRADGPAAVRLRASRSQPPGEPVC